MYRLCARAVAQQVQPAKFSQINKTNQPIRLFARASNPSWTVRGGQRMSLKEKLMQPTTGLPFAYGKAAVLGASALGVVSLAYYGSGLSSKPGALERSMMWGTLVRDRIRTTYQYFGSGIVVSAASAAMILRSPALMRLVANNSIPAALITMAGVFASSMLVHSIPYQPGFGAKQLAFMTHAAMIGAILAPMSFVGGQVLIRAAVYTAGIVGGLSSIAACAPSDQFLSWGAPLGIGLGAVFAANIGSLFLSPATAVGAGLASVVLYGGLILFSGFLLYDTQRIIKRAETTPLYATRPFDPVNESLSIYMDTINIFIRLVMILSGQRKK